jgi:hypothetical protein
MAIINTERPVRKTMLFLDVFVEKRAKNGSVAGRDIDPPTATIVAIM